MLRNIWKKYIKSWLTSGVSCKKKLLKVVKEKELLKESEL